MWVMGLTRAAKNQTNLVLNSLTVPMAERGLELVDFWLIETAVVFGADQKIKT